MEWDDDFGYEFLKFDPCNTAEITDWSANKSILYVELDWESLDEYVNQWNKKRRRVLVINQITSRLGTPFNADQIKELHNTWLDLGARLYKAIKPFASKKVKYLRIIKDSNPMDKFDTWYTATSYKPSFQEKLEKPKSTKK